MRIRTLGVVLTAAGLAHAGLASSSEPTMAEMRWHRRVLIISADNPADPQCLAQERALSQWTGGEDRDVSVVRIERDSVSGSRESAAELRTRYHLPTRTFTVVLIGKDGHVALRSPTALSGLRLETAIDAMPMRKAGQR